MKTLRVLIVDDSAFNRRTIAEIMGGIDAVEVVGKAGDGEEALRLLSQVSPDLILLDLEMPRMDGFTFLRLVMANRPVPVIVVSGHAEKDNVFRALELGAIDFIAKPSRSLMTDVSQVRTLLTEKVEMVRQLSLQVSTRVSSAATASGGTATGLFSIPPVLDSRVKPAETGAKHVIAIGSSAGGPTALLEVFTRLPSTGHAAIVVAQHMPERFTKTFAERLDRLSAYKVVEATDGEPLVAGKAYLCPGGRCIELQQRGPDVVVRVLLPAETDRFIPSVDRLFDTGATALGDKLTAVVLTGMGDDGSRALKAVREAGGVVLAEAPETAVIYGMPGAAHRTGHVNRSLPLKELADFLAQRAAQAVPTREG